MLQCLRFCEQLLNTDEVLHKLKVFNPQYMPNTLQSFLPKTFTVLHLSSAVSRSILTAM